MEKGSQSVYLHKGQINESRQKPKTLASRLPYTVVLGCLTRASLGVLPVGCLRALAVARVGVSDEWH